MCLATARMPPSSWLLHFKERGNIVTIPISLPVWQTSASKWGKRKLALHLPSHKNSCALSLDYRVWFKNQ